MKMWRRRPRRRGNSPETVKNLQLSEQPFMGLWLTPKL